MYKKIQRWQHHQPMGLVLELSGTENYTFAFLRRKGQSSNK
jgi:hypothetical protein